MSSTQSLNPKFSAARTTQSNRETVESIVVAVILAFLFRTFVAEAFVIPTGSMAPTLLGNHKDVECPKCGYAYQGGASCENEERVGGELETAVATTCPVCHYTMTLNWLDDANQATFTGDRIIVNKFAYDLSEPARWDVIVFKYPGNAKINYIKRLVGLPNESLLLKNGDVFAAPAEGEKYQIQRKPPHKQLAMMQIVDDTDHSSRIAELAEIDWPSRWQHFPEPKTLRTVADDLNGLAFDGQGDEQWARYRHLVLDGSRWKKVDAGERPLVEAARGELISDFGGYDAVVKRGGAPVDFKIRADQRYYPDAEQDGLNWVGDLALEAQLTVTGSTGLVLLDLVEGGVHFRCKINITTGRAALSSSDPSLSFAGNADPIGQTPLKGPGQYDIRYSNFDDEIRLWVNEELITFDTPATYGGSPDDVPVPKWQSHDPGDLQPIGIGAKGLQLVATKLRVWRDVYYIAGTQDYREYQYGSRVRNIFRDPDSWSRERLFQLRKHERFLLGPDQYFPLGDNSAHSADARVWDAPKFVEREMLIGKAAAVYWPHSWNRPVPFLPNIPRMRLIH